MLQSTHPDSAAAALHVVRPQEGILGSLRILAGVEQTRGRYFAFESETAPAPSTPWLPGRQGAAEWPALHCRAPTRDTTVAFARWPGGPRPVVSSRTSARHSSRTVPVPGWAKMSDCCHTAKTTHVQTSGGLHNGPRE